MNDTEILLKIQREYSKSEALSVVLSELKQCKFKNGEHISEISELKSEIDKLRMIPTSNGRTKRQWLQDEIVLEVNKENKELRKVNSNLRRELKTYKDRYFYLLARANFNNE